MPKISLPVFFSQSHDETALPDQVGARLVNGYVDKIGDQTVIRKAPGLETIASITPTVTTASLYAGYPSNANVANIAFSYAIGGVYYYKAADLAGTAPGNDVIVAAKWGAVALDIDYAGSITAVEATGQVAAEFTTEALAIAALPAPASTVHRMGWVTATDSAGTFTFGSDNLVTAGTVTVNFYNNTNSPSVVTPFPMDGAFWWEDKAIMVYVCNGRVFTQSTPGGALTDITGDALSVVGHTTACTNGWALFLASGGKILTWHLYASPITAPTIAIGTSDPIKIKYSSFTYYIDGVEYSATGSEISPGNDIIPTGKFGAVALDIDSSGTVTIAEATGNSTGYTSYIDAFAGIPACAGDKCRMGWLAAGKTGGFTFGTTSLNDADEVRWSDNTLYSAEKTAFLADTDAPTTVSHVAYLDDYIIGNEVSTGRFWWCDAGTPYTWGALSFATAEGQPDKVVALHVSNREITLFGTSSVETFYNDGESPFSRYDGGYVEVGCIAPYTIVGMAGSFIFLSHERRVVLLENRTPTPMSSPFDDVIRDIDKVSDAYAIYFALGVQSFYAISFPSVERTFVLNLTTKTWSEWGDWDPPEFKLYKARCYCYARDWEMHIVGDNENGYLYKIRGDHFKHGADNIRTLVRTGHISHDTYEAKISEELMLRMKRGSGPDIFDGYEYSEDGYIISEDGTYVTDEDGDRFDSEVYVLGSNYRPPYVSIRWRNQDMEWKPEKFISLGKSGDYDIIKRLFRNGVYRTRQYEIVHEDPSDFVLSDMEEKIMLVGNPSPRGRQ